MGTYETRGGSPASPECEEDYIFPLEEHVLQLLELTDSDTETNDKICKAISANERRWHRKLGLLQSELAALKSEARKEGSET